MQILVLILEIILIIAILSSFMMRSVKYPILKSLTVYLTMKNDYHDFCDIELMKEEVEDKCSGLILALDKFDPTY